MNILYCNGSLIMVDYTIPKISILFKYHLVIIIPIHVIIELDVIITLASISMRYIRKVFYII
jgi:hypothetical protein